ncbi:transcriptional regulator [Kitasatospora sp. MMS16-BH015]|uniref:helix-turn-helix domain-containing protein n=1 Tax=Kitasatospora sp. MMS16-BH015 TaxID=2018025 RepID=UPI000CA3F14C|nr:helix-turn-helix domain-containing protein [Kitasatospora sp. MMS16-BH015]AUG81703.1 transcriptional regulator [Kitasatospora sp. MMS16-BH015]
MTAHNETAHDGAAGAPRPERVPELGGVPVHELLRAAAPALAPAVLARLVAALPAYGALPSEQLRGEITREVDRAIRAFTEVLRTGALPDEAELARISESSARRADEGVPLEAVVGAYHFGAQECSDRVLAAAGPADLADVLLVQHRLLDYLRLVSCAVAAGYVRERQAALSDEQVARQALLSSLLAGGDARAAADRAGLALPPGYVVLGLAVGPHPDELLPGVNHAVAARRKLRRLRGELQRRLPGDLLSALSGSGGLVLLPADRAPTDLGDLDRPALARLVEDLGRACGGELLAAAAAAPPAGVAAAARLVGEIRELAAGAGRGPGLHLLDDVLLEYQLSRPGPARDRLAARLTPLLQRPELLDTLRAFLGAGLDRRQAAARLQVHPNTVDYRLRRAAELTGLDAARGPDQLTLRAALAAHDLG